MINFNLASYKITRGMTYIELIVVLGIFSTMLSIAMFNHNKFQDKVAIKALANEIALKIVEAQKSSINGKWNSAATSDWKPSYGVYFTSNSTKFIYFADLNSSNTCSDPGCASFTLGGEVLDVISMTRGNSISVSGLEVTGTGCPATVTNLTVVFRRPDSSALIASSPSCTISQAIVNIVSPSGLSAKIKFYPSGRVQIN
ncbi:MAG: hypothetical protein A3A26_00070 [Candidatus Zambryskibacteria bacterium RIFCSPLOWO2_01_FULL_47_14]|uniref:General secretion pathway GspH domain-containing protein n=1 Tax=Candidatus Zambryskibacteria bacterium RIFCSPLOWO2_01_FULL_47_14 TaxID=1802763 RepID=A0A1G2UB43_9BACT|nr:MAG: hypothetical protein A3A26_00070 [Candidatus Zambryskibacteria bacterium RIFCSPLOWO2_01_FULL_47_14]